MNTETIVDSNSLILKTLAQKSQLKLNVYNNTLEAFKSMKKVARYLAGNFRKQLKSVDDRIAVEFKDQGPFQFGLKIAGDTIIFSMHTNVFAFDRKHPVWNTPTVKKDEYASYCGMIHIYNFLSDSFKYNRFEDLGYLIGRLFINKDGHFFVEGKRQLGVLFNSFGKEPIDKKNIRSIIQAAVLFSLDFDLLVPPYDQVAVASVEQLQRKSNSNQIKTAKRLGFKFYEEDENLTYL
jgi:hypothetical protein